MPPRKKRQCADVSTPRVVWKRHEEEEGVGKTDGTWTGPRWRALKPSSEGNNGEAPGGKVEEQRKRGGCPFVFSKTCVSVRNIAVARGGR